MRACRPRAAPAQPSLVVLKVWRWQGLGARAAGARGKDRLGHVFFFRTGKLRTEADAGHTGLRCRSLSDIRNKLDEHRPKECRSTSLALRFDLKRSPFGPRGPAPSAASSPSPSKLRAVPFQQQRRPSRSAPGLGVQSEIHTISFKACGPKWATKKMFRRLVQGTRADTCAPDCLEVWRRCTTRGTSGNCHSRRRVPGRCEAGGASGA